MAFVGQRLGGRAVRGAGHPRRRPAARRAGHRVRVAAVSHRRHLQRREGLGRDARAVRDRASSRTCGSTSTATSLVVIVEERPVIANIDFVGTKEFDKDALNKALKDIGIGEGRPFDKALADRAEQELKRQYLNKSLYGAEVVTTVTPHERNRVNLTFTVTEGEPAKISEIRIVGNKAFSRVARCKGLFDLNDRRLAQLVHQGRPLLARQAQRRPRDAARLLPEPRLPRDSASSRRRSRSRPTSRTSRSRSTSSEGEPYTVTGVQARGRLPRQGRRVQVAGRRSSPASRTAPTAVAETTKRLHRPLRHLRLRLRQGRRAARDRPRQRPRRRSRSSPSRAPRLRAPHQHRRQHPHARRGDPARVPPVRVVAGTTPTRSSCRATASTASATSTTSTSTPPRCRARPTRST